VIFADFYIFLHRPQQLNDCSAVLDSLLVLDEIASVPAPSRNCWC